MDDIESDSITYLVDYLFQQLPDDAELKYIDAQKIFYLVKKRLDSENQIARSLPIYWYVHGPMSKSVSYATASAKNEGIINGMTTSTGGQVFKAGTNDPPEVERNSDLIAAENAIENVLEDYDIFTSLDERLEEEIYVDAPFEFQTYYKFDVLPKIEEFSHEFFIQTEPPEEIAFRLARAEAKFPGESSFDECQERFSRFVTIAETYLENVDEVEKELAEVFYDLAASAWFLFAKKLRIVRHDEAYDDNVDGWVANYRNFRYSFDTDLHSFEELVNERYKLEGRRTTSRVPEDVAWGRVGTALLSGNEESPSQASNSDES